MQCGLVELLGLAPAEPFPEVGACAHAGQPASYALPRITCIQPEAIQSYQVNNPKPSSLKDSSLGSENLFR